MLFRSPPWWPESRSHRGIEAMPLALLVLLCARADRQAGTHRRNEHMVGVVSWALRLAPVWKFRVSVEILNRYLDILSVCWMVEWTVEWADRRIGCLSRLLSRGRSRTRMVFSARLPHAICSRGTRVRAPPSVPASIPSRLGLPKSLQPRNPLYALPTLQMIMIIMNIIHIINIIVMMIILIIMIMILPDTSHRRGQPPSVSRRLPEGGRDKQGLLLLLLLLLCLLCL